MKHFGVLAHSWEGGSLCFRTFCQDGFEQLGGHEHPDVTLDCISFGRSMAAWDAGDHDSIRATLALSVDRLAKAGADFFACPDNTAHMALERPGSDFAIPGLHICEVVADRALADGYSRIGLLGTRYTMEGPLYPRSLAARGLAAVIPDEDDRAKIHEIIFGELVAGVFTDESRRTYAAIIDRLADRGCDAVALVCTEIPLLVTPDVSALPTLDSTRLLAHTAFEVATGQRELPRWRGGPI
ncbi:aspartate/glutamate racemase family protein [Prauserella endophytica]|uniref:Amino acid racemase n=1 Tax=Prauserella endophytica TaxID=1592324 RepID=A0ABY2RWT2_9PSEU|nr:amino acid racemase [Prauserella endophytica]PXY23233.1 aspartate racemase [Prauserella coralliicola]TKG61825.1 amino acid racemase [Prauserella endophytica]